MCPEPLSGRPPVGVVGIRVKVAVRAGTPSLPSRRCHVSAGIYGGERAIGPVVHGQEGFPATAEDTGRMLH